ESNNSESVHDLTQDTDSDNEDDSTLDEFDCGEEVANIQESEKKENDVYYKNESIEYSNIWD
ncbi:19449_t:CDS:2, partial [Dentiscutata erythropus]